MLDMFALPSFSPGSLSQRRINLLWIRCPFFQPAGYRTEILWVSITPDPICDADEHSRSWTTRHLLTSGIQRRVVPGHGHLPIDVRLGSVSETPETLNLSNRLSLSPVSRPSSSSLLTSVPRLLASKQEQG